MNNNSHSIRHTQGEIARRLANQSEDPLQRRSLRRVAREKTGGHSGEYDLNTRARLAFDEFRELAEAFEWPDDKPPPALIEAAKEAETTIQRAIQLFPESSELLATEATLRDYLDQTGRAQRALERAFALNPRQDWLAVRLAERYQSNHDTAAAKRILEACLQDNPSSKIAHMGLGRLLIVTGEESLGLEHLKRSFTEGDNHYEAQFWYARQLYLTGHVPDAERLFASINERAPGRFRTKSGAIIESNGLPTLFEGYVQRKEEGYAFIMLPQFPDAIFASRAESDPSDWEVLKNNVRIRCHFGFTRRGIRATNVQAI